jgi:hypothetical protein
MGDNGIVANVTLELKVIETEFVGEELNLKCQGMWELGVVCIVVEM